MQHFDQMDVSGDGFVDQEEIMLFNRSKGGGSDDGSQAAA
jgi:hypothetical protein